MLKKYFDSSIIFQGRCGSQLFILYAIFFYDYRKFIQISKNEYDVYLIKVLITRRPKWKRLLLTTWKDTRSTWHKHRMAKQIGTCTVLIHFLKIWLFFFVLLNSPRIVFRIIIAFKFYVTRLHYTIKHTQSFELLHPEVLLTFFLLINLLVYTRVVDNM